jgi:hypothetical protein
LLVDFLVYFVLDIFPYATYFSKPYDQTSDPMTWVRLGFLSLSAVVIPLTVPRPFRPSTVDTKPSEEDTASLLSAYTFSFLDPIIFLANRVGNVTPEDMPEIPEQEKVEILSNKAFKHLDPVHAGKRNVVWGLLRVWC